MEPVEIMAIMVLSTSAVLTIGALAIAFYHKRKMDREAQTS